MAIIKKRDHKENWWVMKDFLEAPEVRNEEGKAGHFKQRAHRQKPRLIKSYGI